MRPVDDRGGGVIGRSKKGRQKKDLKAVFASRL